MNNTNWVLSLEDMAAEPTYSEVPKIGLQTDDFTTEPRSMAQPLVDRGFGVELPLHLDASTEADDMPNGIIDPDIPQPAYSGQLISVVSKWPSELVIPTHGNVVAMGLSDDEIKAIADDGYVVYTNMESCAEAMWLLKAQIGMEGWFAAEKPDLGLTTYGGNLKVLKETYLNQSWVEKRGLREGQFTMNGANFVVDGRYLTLLKLMKTTHDKNASVMSRVTNDVYPVARGMYEDKWKNPKWVTEQLAKAHTVKNKGAHATMEVAVQCNPVEFVELPTVKPEKGKVDVIGSSAAIVAVAKELEHLMLTKFGAHPQYNDHRYLNVMMTGDEFSQHHPEGEMAEEILKVSEDHPALKLLGQLYDTFHYVDNQFGNSHHRLYTAMAHALKNWLEGSIK